MQFKKGMSDYNKKKSEFEQRREQRRQAQPGEAVDEEDEPEPEKPEKGDVKDSVVNRATWVGTGLFLKKQGGVAFLALHEGRSWLPNTFEGGSGGGIEELLACFTFTCLVFALALWQSLTYLG